MNPRLVDVYSVLLDESEARLDACYAMLSRQERERSGLFRSAKLRQRFIVGRGTVREILGRYLGMTPSRLEFSYNVYGKPSLPWSGLRFNVSNSHQWALIAVTRGREVGVDIERIDSSFMRDQIPEHFFSPREVATLRQLPAAQQTDAFFRCWTRKEAYIKARGMGLALALDSFDVTLAPQEPAAFLYGARNYSLKELPAPAGFQAAIAAEGSDWSVRCVSYDRAARVA